MRVYEHYYILIDDIALARQKRLLGHSCRFGVYYVTSWPILLNYRGAVA